MEIVVYYLHGDMVYRAVLTAVLSGLLVVVVVVDCVLLLGILDTVVSTTTSGWTTISWDEYWLGSSVMVVREMSEGIRGCTRRLLWGRLGSGLGEGSGDGGSMRSDPSRGITCGGTYIVKSQPSTLSYNL